MSVNNMKNKIVLLCCFLLVFNIVVTGAVLCMDEAIPKMFHPRVYYPGEVMELIRCNVENMTFNGGVLFE